MTRRILVRLGLLAPPAASAPTRREVVVPDPTPQELATLQAACRDWSLMWSKWRRAYTAIARFGATPTIIDDADPVRLLERCRQIELAVRYGRAVVA